MEKAAHRRHDITDKVWEKLEPYLPGRQGSWGGIAQDNRLFINAIFWITRTGSPWRDLPPDLGHWSNTHRRFIRWHDKGVWEKLMEILMDSPDYEWLMIDASHCKVHPPASGAVGGESGHEPYKRGLNTKLHLAVDAHGMPVRFALTEGTTADCKQAVALIEGLDAEHPLADKAYDTNEIVDYAQEPSIDLVVPHQKESHTSAYIR